MKCLNIDADSKYQLKVRMLDGSEMDYEITDETQTEDLLDLVFKQLDLNENIFFGLYNLSNDDRKNWLVNNKKISRQITINSSKSIPRLYFGIKFYIDNPCKLKDESSRYQFFLQIKKDILDGKLDIPFDLSANLFAYALQSELGDYDSEMHKNNYASNYKFKPNQTRKLEEKAEELHKNLIGKMPASVEFNFLEEVKNLELYGTILYPIMTDEDEENYLALSPTGVMILHRNSLFAHYYWSNIIGVYKKGKYFMIKVFNKDNEKTTYGFELANKKLCKNLWKFCVEYQLFYKLIQAYYENNLSNTTTNQNQLDELTQRFRSINLNKLMINKRKTISNIFQYLIQHINSLNKNSSPKDHLKTDQLSGINFTADEIYQDNHDLNEVENEKIKLNVNHHEKLRHELNKNEPTNLPNGFYLVNQQQQQQQQQQQLTNTSVQANNKLASSENKTNAVLQNTLNKRKPLNTYISTPGYNVESTNIVPTTRNRKCESVFSVRSQRSRAAYSEMAYSENNRHNHHKHHKNCSHKRNKEHRHRKQSSCSHRHKDYHLRYEDECGNLSFDEFEESIKHHHHHGRKNRSRSYHTLCDDIDHKYFNEHDETDNCCKKRNRHSNRSRRRRHRSCCLNELRYDSGQEEDEEFFSNDQDDENVSLCSSIHSLNNSKEHCKRKHKNKESHSRLSLKMEKEDNDKISEIRPIIKNASFKNLKLIDCDELEEKERENEDNQSNDSDALSYCSHHSRKSKHSKSCHRSRSKCRHSSRSRCKHHYHRTDSYSDLLDRKQYERSSSMRKRNKNLSCESLSDDEIEPQHHHQINEQKQHKPINNDNKDKFYRSNNGTTQTLINAHNNQQQYIQKSQQPKIDYHFNHKLQKTNNQYLLPPQQFSNQYAYDYNNQTIQEIPKYNTINYNYRPQPVNEHQLHQIQNHQNFAPQNYLPNYSTITTNIIKPIQYNNQQIGLPNVYQLNNNQFKTNNGMYLTPSNNLQSIPTKNEHQLTNDKNVKQQQVYQNLQDYLLKDNRFNNPDSCDVPKLPPRNNLLAKNLDQIQAPPIPSKPPLSNPIVNKLNLNVKNYKTQLFEDNSLYAKPNKLINKNELNQNIENDNQLNEDIVKQTQNSINSGDSANSSLQNINLDSGISICSTSTPTNDLRYSNVTKSNELNNKQNDEIISNGLIDNNLKQNNNDNQNENKPNNYELNNDDQKIIKQKTNKNQSNQQQNKPLEYYEINADFNSTRPTAAFSNAEYPTVPKLKCYEISTEL